MRVLVTYNNGDDSVKNEGVRVVTTFSNYTSMGIFSRRSRAANSAVLGRIWPIFKTYKDTMVVLVTCKNVKDPIKNEGNRVLTRVSPLLNYGHWNQSSDPI